MSLETKELDYEKAGPYSTLLLVGGVQVGIQNLEYLIIKEWLFDTIPRLEMKFVDPAIYGQFKLLKKDELIQYMIKDPSNTIIHYSEWLVNDVKYGSSSQDISRQIFTISLTAVLKLDKIHQLQTRSFSKKTSSEVIKTVSEEMGFTFENKLSLEDKMTYLQANQSNIDFLNDVQKLSYKSNDIIYWFGETGNSVNSDTKMEHRPTFRSGSMKDLSMVKDKDTILFFNDPMTMASIYDESINPYDNDKDYYCYIPYNTLDSYDIAGTVSNIESDGVCLTLNSLQEEEQKRNKEKTHLNFFNGFINSNNKNRNSNDYFVSNINLGLYSSDNVHSNYKNLSVNKNSIFTNVKYINHQISNNVKLFSKAKLRIPTKGSLGANTVLGGEYLVIAKFIIQNKQMVTARICLASNTYDLVKDDGTVKDDTN